ncbi:hypothetical protein TNCV_4839491 [Trichonephila clavipes]|nr:hypothetical protein TNCV_4839491 [Trichonephila clavipes]
MQEFPAHRVQKRGCPSQKLISRIDRQLLLPTVSDLYQFPMKLRLVHLIFFAALLTIAYGRDEEDLDYEPDKDEETPPRKKNPDYVPRHRRPLDLRIRVPFFKMLLKRDKTGPAK